MPSLARKTAATVEVIDYEANLALLQPVEKSFLDGITPLEIAPGHGSGRPAGCMAIGADRRVTRDGGLGHNCPNDALSDRRWEFLTYRISIPMQYRENSYTVPLVKKNKLAGLLLRYDSRSQLLDAIPAPVITHFLKDAESQNYRGFPSAGFSFFPTRDPALREFAGEKARMPAESM